MVDASVVLEVLLGTPAGRRLEGRLRGKRQSLHAPELIDLEVAQVLRRLTLSGAMSGTRGRDAVKSLVDFPLRRYPHRPFLARIWELRRNMTAYDAAYVALAEALGVPLLSADARLGAAPGHRAVIEVV